jgi:glycosyltransferase involved in cell wall biosynthesis
VRSRGPGAAFLDIQSCRAPSRSDVSHRRLRMAQAAPVVETVPPARYGGTEQVIATRTEELVARDREVSLFASGDSRTSARLVPVVVDQSLWYSELDPGNLTPFAAITWGAGVSRDRQVRYRAPSPWSAGYLFGRAPTSLVPPVVTTLHGRLDFPEIQALHLEFAEAPVVSISHARRRQLADANWEATVPNGIPLQHLTSNPKPGNYLAFPGRISPDKGLDTGIRVALRAGLPIRIVAREPLSFHENAEERRDWEYYEQVVRPRFREPGVEYIGQVGREEKNALLRDAVALLFPIRWPEPFGLVGPKALACGTPVLALRRGSVPEIIRDGHTGFIRDTEDQLVEAVEQIPTIDRACCRAEAEHRCSAHAVADAYGSVHRRLLAGSASSRAVP